MSRHKVNVEEESLISENDDAKRAIEIVCQGIK